MRDVDAAVEFYHRLGLTSLPRPDFGFQDPGGNIVELNQPDRSH